MEGTLAFFAARISLMLSPTMIVRAGSPPAFSSRLVSLAERGVYGYGEEPDRIILFRENLLQHCGDRDELVQEIRVTLVHEIAHFYGIDDAELHRLGWA